MENNTPYEAMMKAMQTFSENAKVVLNDAVNAMTPAEKELYIKSQANLELNSKVKELNLTLEELKSRFKL